LADLDGDGKLDMFSGSYWPGDITRFPGLGGGKYGKGEILKDKDGKNLNAGPPWKSERKPEMDSLAASPWLVDFDGDGDLDLLIGNISGYVVLLANEGDQKQPAFVRKYRLQAAGSDLKVNGDAGPTTADWDGDGKWDLLVGAGDGAVTWFRNTGTPTVPVFAGGEDLIAANKGRGARNGQERQRPGSRTKVAVVDWNADGQLDLLIGDYTSVQMPEPVLSKEDQSRRDALRKQRDALMEKMGPLWQKEAEDKLSDADKKQLADWNAENSKIWEGLRPLEAEHKASGGVWVYLRKQAPESGAPR
jgi:hypothetical protein